MSGKTFPKNASPGKVFLLAGPKNKLYLSEKPARENN
jgi:hypothetical protein